MLQPMTFDASVSGDLMKKHFRRAQMLGLTKASGAEQFYGFHCHDVETVHFHKHGAGDGFWFRLKDGRVFDWRAMPSEPDRAYYGFWAH